MDFLDPKKKRAHKIRLYIGYALMAIALAVGSTILFFEARGFDISRKTGEVIQNGLVFVDAHPEQADVYVNGKHEGKTDMRLTIPAGEYTFEFAREGYRTWKRTFRLAGSQIERLNYAFLFPEKLEPAEIRPYTATPAFATQSPDRKWLVIQRPGQFTTFDVLDLSSQTSPSVTSAILPNDIVNLSAGSNTLEPIEWASDNRHLLVKHSFKGGSEFLMIDRETPAKSINLNKHLGVPLVRVALRDKKFDKLHVLDKNGGTLRFVDTKTKQFTDVATKVFSFKSYSDTVLFYVTGKDAKKDRVNVNILDGKKDLKIRELPIADKYPINITRYDDEWYMAVGSSADKRAYVYHDVFRAREKSPSLLPLPIAVFKLEQLDDIAISANARFISAQGGSEFAVYDAEHDARYQYNTKLKFAKGQKASWMDGHRLAAIINGKLTVWDYDGINMQTLVDANPKFLPFFDRDYDFLYVIAPSTTAKNQSAFTKTPMRTAADL